MKVFVLWENPGEEARAKNLVAVLKVIGQMLVYGEVRDDGVQIRDWASKPRTKLECLAGELPSALQGKNTRAIRPGSYELPPGVPVYQTMSYLPDMMETMTREALREMVRMFPDDTPKKKVKPVVPKPNTTETGVTVRELDMWEEDDDHDH